MQYQDMEVYKPKYDVVFKEIFLGDMDLLASLLSSIMDIDIKAENMDILNTELVPEYESGRLSRLDIRIKTADRDFDLEMQLNNRYNMDKRSVFYLSKLYIEQMTKSMKFKELHSVVAINILDFPYLSYKEYHNQYRLKNMRTDDELTDVIEIHFIELPKVCMADNVGMKDLWMMFLSAEDGEALEMLSKKDPMIEKAVKRLVYVSADEKVRYDMAMREKAELDYYNDISDSFDRGFDTGEAKGKAEGLAEGKAEGLAEGKAEGLAEGKAEIVRNMKMGNMTVDDIARLTKLSVAEVEKYFN